MIQKYSSTVAHDRVNDLSNGKTQTGVECVNAAMANLGGGLVSGWLLSMPNTS